MTVRLRLFAAARQAAGCAADTFDTSDTSDTSGKSNDAEANVVTLGALLDRARARYGQEFVDVLGAARVWVNGDEPERGDATVLRDGDEVAVLPPVSGG